jgi:hypothetical protein
MLLASLPLRRMKAGTATTTEGQYRPIKQNRHMEGVRMFSKKQPGVDSGTNEDRPQRIEIKKGLPPPPASRAEPKWPFAKMEVNDYIEVPIRDRNAAATAARTLSKKTGKRFRFALAKDEATGDELVRCWRVE